MGFRVVKSAVGEEVFIVDVVECVVWFVVGFVE